MSFTSRTQARAQECPACGAQVGQRCIGARGKERESVHRERMQAAAGQTGTKARPTLSLDGNELVDAQGNVMATVVGLEIDFLGDPWGTYGGEREGPVVASSSESPTQLEGVQGEQTALLPDALREVWEHYQRSIPNGDRRKLDARRKTVIRKALSVRTADECKLAITRLSQSSFHQGRNDRNTAYNDIEYALGKKSDSPDAVIDRWLEKTGPSSEQTPVAQKLAALSEVQRRIANERMQKVRRMFRSPSHEPTVRAGQEARQQLAEHPGIVVIEDERGAFIRWEVA